MTKEKPREVKAEYQGDFFAGIFSHLSDTGYNRYEICVGLSREEVYKKLREASTIARLYETVKVYNDLNINAIAIIENTMDNANKRRSEINFNNLDSILNK